MATGRSYPASEVRGGGREELPRVRGQWRPEEDTLSPRPVAAGRRHLASEVRSSPEEPPEPEARASDQEEESEEQWLRRHRRT